MFQTKPLDYAKVVDMVVATGMFFSGGLVESILTGARGLFYDYPNLHNIETDLYSWGYKKVLFTDLDEMISNLKAYKEDRSSNSAFGDWSGHLDNLDPFRDGCGAKRIGTYTSVLQEGFDEGLKREEAIARANARYAAAWGSNTVYFDPNDNATRMPLG